MSEYGRLDGKELVIMLYLSPDYHTYRKRFYDKIPQILHDWKDQIITLDSLSKIRSELLLYERDSNEFEVVLRKVFQQVELLAEYYDSANEFIEYVKWYITKEVRAIEDMRGGSFLGNPTNPSEILGSFHSSHHLFTSSTPRGGIMVLSKEFTVGQVWEFEPFIIYKQTFLG